MGRVVPPRGRAKNRRKPKGGAAGRRANTSKSRKGRTPTRPAPVEEQSASSVDAALGWMAKVTDSVAAVPSSEPTPTRPRRKKQRKGRAASGRLARGALDDLMARADQVLILDSDSADFNEAEMEVEQRLTALANFLDRPARPAPRSQLNVVIDRSGGGKVVDLAHTSDVGALAPIVMPRGFPIELAVDPFLNEQDPFSDDPFAWVPPLQGSRRGPPRCKHAFCAEHWCWESPGHDSVPTFRQPGSRPQPPQRLR